MYLVLIQTSGNQSYIFGTNKLRENVGASQLTYEVGTRFVLEGVTRVVGASDSLWNDDIRLRTARLQDPRVNRAIESGGPLEVVFAASGIALILADTIERGRELVSYVTSRALRAAPGLDVAGCVVFGDLAAVTKAISSAFVEFERVKALKGGQASRHHGIPVVARCATSGLPASATFGSDDLSSVSAAKTDARKRWTKRMRRVFGHDEVTRGWRVTDDLNEFEQRLGEDSWIGVVHADGNGLGSILRNFDRYQDLAAVGGASRQYIDNLRKFSLSLEIAAEAAFLEATKTLKPMPCGDNKPFLAPVLPLLLGGDDLTVITRGADAIRFSHAFLEAFENATSTLQGVDRIKLPRVTACAGIALVKPHFPFHSAYELAEDLVQSAKIVKQAVGEGEMPPSALDFHVLFDSAFASLNAIRARQTAGDSNTLLTEKPYALVAPEDPALPPWLLDHRFDLFRKRVKALQPTTGEGRALPRGQMHALRAALFEGPAVADRRVAAMLHRYPVLSKVLESLDGPSVFRKSIATDAKATNRLETGLLDAMEVADGLFDGARP